MPDNHTQNEYPARSDNNASIAATIIIMGRAGQPPKPRTWYFMTKQLLLHWPPVHWFSPPANCGEWWIGGICISRHYIGIELNSEYLKLARERIAGIEPYLTAAE